MYSGGMERVTLKVSTGTAARLRATMPELSAAADRMLTIDGALAYLLDSWDARMMTTPPRRWGRGLSAEGTGSGPA